jgi:hypothetical protein
MLHIIGREGRQQKNIDYIFFSYPAESWNNFGRKDSPLYWLRIAVISYFLTRPEVKLLQSPRYSTLLAEKVDSQRKFSFYFLYSNAWGSSNNVSRQSVRIAAIFLRGRKLNNFSRKDATLYWQRR